MTNTKQNEPTSKSCKNSRKIFTRGREEESAASFIDEVVNTMDLESGSLD